MLKRTFQDSISYLLCLAALAGVALHDTKLDKLATVTVGASAGVIASAGADGILRPGSDLHTHVEKVSLHRLAFEQPRLQSRYLEDKRLLSQKKVSKGEHPFDGYFIPA